MKRKLYHNGDIYDGQKIVTTIAREEVVTWLLSLNPTRRSRYLEDPNTIEEKYEKSLSDSIGLKDAMERAGYMGETGDQEVLCRHAFIFIERSYGEYVFACKHCLIIKSKKAL